MQTLERRGRSNRSTEGNAVERACASQQVVTDLQICAPGWLVHFWLHVGGLKVKTGGCLLK